MLSTVVPVAPDPDDIANEYTVHATVYNSTEDATVFMDDSGREWIIVTSEETYIKDTRYVLVVYNNLTQETADDYVISVMRYFPMEDV